MQKLTYRFLLLFLFLESYTITLAQQDHRNKLWYNAPANAAVKDQSYKWDSDPEWLKALPIGNGRLGAMVFGDPYLERLQLNEISLWSGSVEEGDNPVAATALNEIRSLLFQGKYKEAKELTQRTQITKGKGSGHGNGANVPFGSFQTLGDLYLDFQDKSAYEDYYRELDMIKGMTTTRFKQSGVNYTRKAFASFPDQVIVLQLDADKKGKLNFDMSMNRPERYQTDVSEQKGLVMTGAMNNGKGGDGMQYIAQVKPLVSGGVVNFLKDKIQIRNADKVTIILGARTDYRLQYPNYKNPNYRIDLNKDFRAQNKSFKSLFKNHVADFSSFMKRVEFELAELPTLPTDSLLALNGKSGNIEALYPLYFQMGRYLLLSSSRPGSLPSNLQGLWSNKIQSPWNGDYHTDINVQMNYWPAGVTNLIETQLPLIDLMESLQEPGKKTAQAQYGMNGWILHPITNVWGYTSPGEHASWGMHIGAGAWIAQHLWLHYLYTKDEKFLQRVYPMLKQASLFYLDWLVSEPGTNRLVSGPSPSPENSFKAPDGTVVQISMGPSHDQQVILDLFENTSAAHRILGKANEAWLDSLKDAIPRLAPFKIGKDGRLMEWAEEFPEVEKHHRHLSHLFALYPGDQISLEKTPELVEASRKSLETRGDDGVGWAYAWKIALWARLKDGDRSLKILNKLLRPTKDFDTKYDGGGATYFNLFNAGPPFQIDGNFGVLAGMAEMFLQSHEDYIEALPALPSAWKKGKMNGLVARGGLVLDMEWENGKISSLYAKASHSGVYKFKIAGKITEFKLRKNNRVQII